MKLTESVETLGQPVAYYPNVARWLGGDVSAAVFLCQFMYWRKKVGERQIYKTRAEIERETGISAKIQRRICEKLTDQGLLSIEKKSMPARNYYTFNWQEIDRQFEEWSSQKGTSSGDHRAPLEVTIGNDKSVPSGTTTSEITTEITTEITREDTPPSKPKRAKIVHIEHEGYKLPVGKTRMDKIIGDFGDFVFYRYLTRVILYCESKTKWPYKDYAATVWKWMQDDIAKGKGPQKRTVETKPKIDARTLSNVSYQ